MTLGEELRAAAKAASDSLLEVPLLPEAEGAAVVEEEALHNCRNIHWMIQDNMTMQDPCRDPGSDGLRG